ncbi:MAG: hypothetical protein KJ072_02640 [Verrucomicrobia bacterium]|nr:hypothetical protein [Verrucomicrobiota bacterium]
MIPKPIRTAARRWQVAIATVSLWVTAAQPAPQETTKPDAQTPARNPMVVADLWIFEPAGPAERVTVPARVHLKNSKGDPVHPDGFPAWQDHFVCDGRARLELPAGDYSFEIERGPEYQRASGSFSLSEATPTQIPVRLERIANLASEGWWSGDLHVHRHLEDVPLLMRAEDLHIAPIITWWNQSNPWTEPPLPTEVPVRMDGNRFYHPLAGEDERDGGALLYFNLDRPLEITGATTHYPSSVVFAREAFWRPVRWIEIEKPFWWDFPMWLAHGFGDSIGIAQNHLQRSGVLDNEAWGRSRDRARFPGPWGNGLYTQELYFHALDCGFRIPPSAGSASGVLPNPVGYNRVYVQLEGELTWPKWWAGLRAGRCFVSNGPLLRARANSQWPGHVFRSRGPLMVHLEAQLDGREPIQAVELIRDGRAERITLPGQFAFHESGWFLVRAVADTPHTLRFAMTAPWYVEIGDPPRPARGRSARLFLDWTRDRMAALEKRVELDATRKAEVLEPWRETERFWEDKLAQAAKTVPVTGRVIEETTRQPVPCRIYVQRSDGRWFFPASAVPHGSAIRYERRATPESFEYHTTLSAHPFELELEPGRYTFTVERGKEYRTATLEVQVGDDPINLELPLKRWVNMAERGWYSGDTHVHRTLADLPNLLLAEDLNVAFPLSYWVTEGFAAPTSNNRAARETAGAELIHVDATHVIWPRNTEWEIFSLHNRAHTLGAVFALGHREPFSLGAPPVGPIAAAARHQGALLDLDKHDWPWSIALIPIMNIDLFELANNHHWRTEFGFTRWSTPAPAYMKLETSPGGGDERAWTLYGFQTYYALLNCGFRLRPTAGTANGVHPVPLGFSRVYVHLPKGFSYNAWKDGLNAGRSFVTTGPMLLVSWMADQVTGTVLSREPVRSVELVLNGQVKSFTLQPVRNSEGAWESTFRLPLEFPSTSWAALRCFEEHPHGRFRFAHTAPHWFEIPGQPLHPRQAELDFLTARVRDELARSRERLPPAAIAEYERALNVYESITTRSD